MDLNDILVFTRVVQTGSFTAAARALDMTKSSVSRRVTGLEDHVGARLLQRSTRKIGLTDIGRAYFEKCERIIAEIEEADLTVSEMQGTARGTLRVSVPLAFGPFGALVAEFTMRYPDVRVEIVATDRRVDLIDEGFDVAIRAGALADSSLIARPLGKIKRLLVASPDYLKQHGQPASPDALKQHACLLFGAVGAVVHWTVRSRSKSIRIDVPARLVVNDFELLRHAARSGMGIASLPEFLCSSDVSAGRLRVVLPNWNTDETAIHAVYATTRHVSSKVTAFVDFLRDEFGSLNEVA